MKMYELLKHKMKHFCDALTRRVPVRCINLMYQKQHKGDIQSFLSVF